MNPNALAAPSVAPIKVPIAAWLIAAVGGGVLYLMLQENGVLLQQGWLTVHELFHDARHALGVPCH
jgi:hypothetical protein